MIQIWQHPNGNTWIVEVSGGRVVAAQWEITHKAGAPLECEPSTLEWLNRYKRDFRVIG